MDSMGYIHAGDDDESSVVHRKNTQHSAAVKYFEKSLAIARIEEDAANQISDKMKNAGTASHASSAI